MYVYTNIMAPDVPCSNFNFSPNQWIICFNAPGACSNKSRRNVGSDAAVAYNHRIDAATAFANGKRYASCSKSARQRSAHDWLEDTNNQDN